MSSLGTLSPDVSGRPPVERLPGFHPAEEEVGLRDLPLGLLLGVAAVVLVGTGSVKKERLFPNWVRDSRSSTTRRTVTLRGEVVVGGGDRGGGDGGVINRSRAHSRAAFVISSYRGRQI